MAGASRSGLKPMRYAHSIEDYLGLNGRGFPFGIETLSISTAYVPASTLAKWPGLPVRD